MDSRKKIAHVVISRDGSLVAAGFLGDDFISLLDVHRNCLNILREPLRCIESLSISDDGRLLASGWENGKIILWDVSGERIAEWEGHPFGVSCLAISPDNTLLISGDREGVICLWEIASRRLVWKSSGYQYRTRRVFFSPDGRIVVSLYDDDLLRVWRANTGDHLWLELYVKWAAFHPSRDRLAIVRPNAVLMRTLSDKGLWWWEDGNWGKSLVAFSPDGSLLAVGSNFGYVTVLDAEKGKTLLKMRGLKGYIPCCLFFSRQWLAVAGHVGGNVGLVQVFSTETGKCLWERMFPKSSSIICLGAFSDGVGEEQLISVDQYGVVAVWDVSDGSMLWLTQL